MDKNTLPNEFLVENLLYEEMLKSFKDVQSYCNVSYESLDKQFKIVKDIARKHKLVCVQGKYYTQEEAKEKFLPLGWNESK